eukprot:m51a1_g4829 hypothetical protein (364) ;mRNA; f:183221-184661
MAQQQRSPSPQGDDAVSSLLDRLDTVDPAARPRLLGALVSNERALRSRAACARVVGHLAALAASAPASDDDDQRYRLWAASQLRRVALCPPANDRSAEALACDALVSRSARALLPTSAPSRVPSPAAPAAMDWAEWSLCCARLRSLAPERPPAAALFPLPAPARALAAELLAACAVAPSPSAAARDANRLLAPLFPRCSALLAACDALSAGAAREAGVVCALFAPWVRAACDAAVCWPDPRAADAAREFASRALCCCPRAAAALSRWLAAARQRAAAAECAELVARGGALALRACLCAALARGAADCVAACVGAALRSEGAAPADVAAVCEDALAALAACQGPAEPEAFACLRRELESLRSQR